MILLRVGAKRRMELSAGSFYNSASELDCIDDLIPVVEAANGFQHIHFSGTQKEGWFRLWTGNTVTTWEDAEFCLHVEWTRYDGLSRINLRSFIAFCDELGAARVRRLVMDSPSPGLQKS
jgi:hypothetical protein